MYDLRLPRPPGRAWSLLAALLGVWVFAVSSTPAAAHDSPWGRDYLPNVPVLDQDRRSLKFYDDLLKGRTTVISFIYTSCRSICPLTLARLAEVKDMLGDKVGRDVFFLSVSIDPIPDTPEKLKEQSEAFKTGTGWTFVTGDSDDIDLIRHKLGERSGGAIAQHKNEVLMYNDVTGQWSRDSAFADLGVLAENIRMMDPTWRDVVRPVMPASISTGAPVETPGQALFIKACASCHTLGRGEKVGPDLAGLLQRRPRSWVTAYITGPQKVRAAKDPVALALRERYRAVRMPELGLSETDAADLIAFLESRETVRAGAETAIAK